MTTTRFTPNFGIQDAPPEDFVEDLRRRFPTDPEVDRMLTAKMRNRSGPPYQRVPLEVMVDNLTRFLKTRLDRPFVISGAKWFAGGVSKIQVGFTLRWTEPLSG